MPERARIADIRIEDVGQPVRAFDNVKGYMVGRRVWLVIDIDPFGVVRFPAEGEEASRFLHAVGSSTHPNEPFAWTVELRLLGPGPE